MVVVRLTTMVADFKTLANEKFIIGGIYNLPTEEHSQNSHTQNHTDRGMYK